MKKNILLFFSSLVIVQLGYAQMSVYDYKREQLKGFKKVIQTRINYRTPADSSISETIYYINSLGEIIKYESYDTVLVMWADFEYNTNGELINEEIHQRVNVYDEKVKDHVPVWEDETYRGTLYEYINGRLIEERHYESDEGEISNRVITRYEYDKHGRKVKATHVDLFMGLSGTFQANSDSITSMYLKEVSDTSQTLYRYSKGSLITTFIDKDKEASHIYSQLNPAGLPIKTIWKDKKGNQILVYSYEYDKKGHLFVEKREFIDEKKIQFDYAAEDELKIIYHENGLPYQSLSYADGKLLARTIVKYE